MELITNEFGSISGELILPRGGITGQYELELYESGDDKSFDATNYLSVEEYKRPKFEANFDPITKSYQLNDTILVSGKAISFAGSNITGAQVSYRVKRQVRYPQWYYRYGYGNSGSEAQEITFGETETDDKGIFNIDFKALPDLSVDKGGLPIFNYEVTADITDINGETQTASTVINLGYHTLLLKLGVATTLDKQDKKQQITLTSENLNNEFVPASGSIEIFKLKAPNSVLRPRTWDAPDYAGFTEAEFRNTFPHDAYQGEDDYRNWEPGERVFSKTFDTETSKEITLGNIKKWESGRYIVIAKTTDSFGQEVEERAYTSLFHNKDAVPSDNQLLTVRRNKNKFNIGEDAIITFASAAPITVSVSIEKDNQMISTKELSLNNSTEAISVPVKETDLGGFVVHYSYAAYNSFSSGSMTISVPYPSHELEVITETFRDRLQPGTPETWSFQVKGPKGEQVSAELLASMYDASLDQFNSHNWDFTPYPEPVYHSNHKYHANHSFGTQRFYLQSSQNYWGGYRQLDYDRFNWFGFTINNGNWVYNQYLSSLRRQVRASYSAETKEGVVNGTIYDENGSPIPGVNIIVKGTSRGTNTDFDGNFSIEINKGEVLQISYLGYITENITIGKKNIYSIYLNLDEPQLEEVVVTALGIKREKKALGYAVSSVEADDLSESEELNEDVIRALPASNSGIEKSRAEDFGKVAIRKNLQETAFFFPQLRTDAKGTVSFNFTTPEALTKWKLQLLSHTKTAESSVTTLEAVTQKELMVLPNVPRFLREGDQITISSKIANLSKKTLSGEAILKLSDAITGKEVDAELSNTQNVQSFSVSEAGNTQVSWTLQIPEGMQSVQYTILAKAGDFSDGEQSALPVLSNRMLVTETLSMWVRSNESRTFTLDKLKNN
ncbi:MAG: carboxypeptidase-like regulatory domain-containing protein, partial [Bacteroidetes bacterium]|nr:carboxypeptidase-like regulatory domain-containing protein [Bacteroidota bacterium]